MTITKADHDPISAANHENQTRVPLVIFVRLPKLNAKARVTIQSKPTTYPFWAAGERGYLAKRSCVELDRWNRPNPQRLLQLRALVHVDLQ